MSDRLCGALVVFWLASLAGPASAQVVDPVPGPIPVGDLAVEVELVAVLPDSGPGSKPTARPMTLTGDGSGRTFVADPNGQVLQLHAGGNVSVFLDLGSATSLFADQRQRGLSSFAFHPDYFDSGADGFGKFYTSSSEPTSAGTPDYPVPAGSPESHHSVIYEWTASGDPDVIDPGSAREILRVGETYDDHNIGQISFRPGLSPVHPDYGLLFVAMGDGGNVCCPRPSVDPWFAGQDVTTLLGTILRVDPLEPPGGGAPYTFPSDNPFASDGDPLTLGEIWAYGLRNPHRFAWDRGGDGRMLISDIGQANVEEINLGALGANYGWSDREGTYSVMHFNEDDVFPLPGNDATFGYTYPVLQYDHDENDRAISGGFVQRQAVGSSLEGRYLFGDMTSGRVFHADVDALDGSGQAAFELLRLIDAVDGQEKSLLEMIGGGLPAPRADLRFGLDDQGRVYLVTKRDGAVRRIVPPLDALPVPFLGPTAGVVLMVCLVAASLPPLRARAGRLE